MCINLNGTGYEMRMTKLIRMLPNCYLPNDVTFIIWIRLNYIASFLIVFADREVIIYNRTFLFSKNEVPCFHCIYIDLDWRCFWNLS